MGVTITRIDNDMFFFSKDYTTAFKGLAILMVVAHHILFQFGLNGPLGQCGVVIFFFLSGYGLNESYIKSRLNGFWLKRIKKVWLPYVALSVPFLLIYEGFDLKRLLLDVTLIQPYYSYKCFNYGWFLPCLFCLYIYFFLTGFFHNNKVRILLLLLVSIPHFFLYPLSVGKDVCAVFTLGVVASNWKCFITQNLKKFGYVGVISLLLVFPIFGICHYDGGVYPDWIVRMWLTSLLVGLGCVLAPYTINADFANFHKGLIKRTMLFVGVISYELYLIHGWVMPLLISHCTILVALLYFVICIVLSYFYFKAIRVIL